MEEQKRISEERRKKVEDAAKAREEYKERMRAAVIIDEPPPEATNKGPKRKFSVARKYCDVYKKKSGCFMFSGKGGRKGRDDGEIMSESGSEGEAGE